MRLGARGKNSSNFVVCRPSSSFLSFFFSLPASHGSRRRDAITRSYAIHRRYGVTKFLHVAIRNVAYYYAYNFYPRPLPPFLSLTLRRSFSFGCDLRTNGTQVL